MTNTILWEDYAFTGSELSVKNGSTVTVGHTDLRGIFIGDDM